MYERFAMCALREHTRGRRPAALALDRGRPDRMAGYFNAEERFELLGGQIVPMSLNGRRHEIIRSDGKHGIGHCPSPP